MIKRSTAWYVLASTGGGAYQLGIVHGPAWWMHLLIGVVGMVTAVCLIIVDSVD